MPAGNYQTIQLSRGKHTSPDDGACVMELASMLAGDKFTDRPPSVCPVIATVLRGYNDSIDDARRQDLYAYASLAVGTAASVDVMEARVARVVEWAVELRRRRWPRSVLPARLRELGLRHVRSTESLGTFALRAIHRHNDATHAAVLALITELAEIGTESRGNGDTPAQGKAFLHQVAG